MRNKKVPKLRKGAWFVRVRGSYLPKTSEAWFMHAILLLLCLGVIMCAFHDTRPVFTIIVSMLLELIGLGAIFTFIASKKS